MVTVHNTKTLRQFGLLVGGIFLFIGILPLLRGEAIRSWALVAGSLLVVPALVFPALLRYPYIGWMFVGSVLGWINTRILLTLLFFFVLTPIGLVMRLLGRDPLKLSPQKDLESYRHVRTKRDANHLERMF